MSSALARVLLVGLLFAGCGIEPNPSPAAFGGGVAGDGGAGDVVDTGGSDGTDPEPIDVTGSGEITDGTSDSGGDTTGDTGDTGDIEPEDCLSSEDTDVLASTDMAPTFHACMSGCMGEPADCAGQCVAEATGLSAGCSLCWGAAVTCAATECTDPCADSEETAACAGCVADSCELEFQQCSGLEVGPLGPVEDPPDGAECQALVDCTLECKDGLTACAATCSAEATPAAVEALETVVQCFAYYCGDSPNGACLQSATSGACAGVLTACLAGAEAAGALACVNPSDLAAHAACGDAGDCPATDALTPQCAACYESELPFTPCAGLPEPSWIPPLCDVVLESPESPELVTWCESMLAGVPDHCAAFSADGYDPVSLWAGCCVAALAGFEPPADVTPQAEVACLAATPCFDLVTDFGGALSTCLASVPESEEQD